MGIQFAPEYGKDLGEALSGVIQGAANIVQPGIFQQRAFEQHLAENPQLLQQLADVNYLSPGALQPLSRMISPRLASSLSTMAPSPEARIQKSANQGGELGTAALTRLATGENPEQAAIGQGRVRAIRAFTGLDQRPAGMSDEDWQNLQDAGGAAIAGSYAWVPRAKITAAGQERVANIRAAAQQLIAQGRVREGLALLNARGEQSLSNSYIQSLGKLMPGVSPDRIKAYINGTADAQTTSDIQTRLVGGIRNNLSQSTSRAMTLLRNASNMYRAGKGNAEAINAAANQANAAIEELNTNRQLFGLQPIPITAGRTPSGIPIIGRDKLTLSGPGGQEFTIDDIDNANNPLNRLTQLSPEDLANATSFIHRNAISLKAADQQLGNEDNNTPTPTSENPTPPAPQPAAGGQKLTVEQMAQQAKNVPTTRLPQLRQRLVEGGWPPASADSVVTRVLAIKRGVK